FFRTVVRARCLMTALMTRAADSTITWELPPRMKPRGFAAYPRAITATEAEVLLVPAKLRIPPVIGSTKTVVAIGDIMNAGPGLWRQTVTASGSDRTPPL